MSRITDISPCNSQKVTGKLLDLSLAPGGEGMGGEGAEAWMGGGGEKIFLLNKSVEFSAGSHVVLHISPAALQIDKG